LAADKTVKHLQSNVSGFGCMHKIGLAYTAGLPDAGNGGLQKIRLAKTFQRMNYIYIKKF